MIPVGLNQLPPHTHPLTLVSDPDGVLAEETTLAALAERGFTLIHEPDPVHLRHRVEAARPFSASRPLVIVTPGPLNQLPYDLWQQGHPVTLALHTFFPDLAYPVVRALSPAQRWRLGQAPAPERPLGQRGSLDFTLRHVFAAEFDALREPAGLIAWLNNHHQGSDPLPPLLAEHLLAHLRQTPAFAGWPLDQLLGDREAFTAFVRDQWLACVEAGTRPDATAARTPYLLPFEADHGLQDTLPRLVRSGALRPVRVSEPELLPAWARPAVLAEDEDRQPRRAAELLGALTELLEPSPEEARWEGWGAIARAWADLTALRFDPDARLTPDQRVACQQMEAALDPAFLSWLRRNYASLGSQRLPVPHHLHHVPHFIAHQRRQRHAGRVALLILDGLALSDWTLIGPTWRARHPDWRLREQLVLAQIPTVTAVSRQALASGLRPADFAATLGDNRAEPGQWAAFWAREGLPEGACPYARLALDRSPPPPAVESARTRALCLVDNTIDHIPHGASLGAADVQASIRLWLESNTAQLEEVIAGLLAREFTVYLTSDHGHVQARGIGQPREGLTVQSRGKRARVYADERAAASVQHTFSETILWGADGLLPDPVRVLMPTGRRAFTTFDEIVVTHGGPTLDEVVVPLVIITGT